MAYITVLCALILLIQAITKRLLTGATLWVAFYYCFFVIAPLLLGMNDSLATMYAQIGITTFLIGYTFSICIALYTEKRYKRINCASPELVTYGFIDSSKVSKYTDFLIRASLVLLVLGLGINGIRSLLRGHLTTATISANSNMFMTLFDYAREWLGYTIVMQVVGNGRKIEKKSIIQLIIFALLTVLFSFTRVSLIYILSLLMIYLMRKESVRKQVGYSIALVAATVVLLSMMIVIRTFGVTELFARFNFNYLKNNIAMTIDFTRIYLSFTDLIHSPVRITPLVYLKPIFAIIPRSLWPGKPMSSAVEIFKQLHFSAWQSGGSTGYTLLGEAFAVCGEIGIYIYPLIFGLIIPLMDSKYIRYVKTGNDRSLKCFFYLYFADVFILQAFRHGTDIALMFLPLYFFVFWLITQVRFKFRIR